MPSVEAASRVEQSVAEVPSSVSVITASDIRRYGYRTLGGILDSVRGFHLSGDRNYSYIGIRGFPRAGSYNTRILVLLDGQRINDSLYEDAGYGYDSLVDVSVIERVEVVRGPGSSVYGSGAFFATVNIITRRGRDIEGTEASLALGSQATGELRAATGRRLDSGLEYVLSASAYTSDGDTALYFPAFDTPADNYGIARNVDTERAQHAFGKLRMGDFTFGVAAVERVKHVPTAAYGTVFGDDRFHTRDQRYFLSAQYNKRINEKASFHSRASINGSYYRGEYPFLLPPVVVQKDKGVSNSWTIENYAVADIWRTHRLTAGVEYRRNVKLEQKTEDIVQHVDISNQSTVLGIYAQDEWRLGENTLLYLGLRRDRYTAFDSMSSPRLALIHKITPNLNLKLLTGRAFRVPNAYELYYKDDSTIFGNPALKPERIRTRELVLEYVSSPRFLASFSVYRNQINDFIRLVTDPATGMDTWQNLDRIDADGAEIEGRWQSATGIELRMALAYQNNRDRLTDTRLQVSPLWTAKLNASLPLPQINGRISAAARSISSRSAPSGANVGGYTVLDAVLDVPLRQLPSVRLTAAVYNLFDRRYGEPGSLEHLQDSIPGQGRSFLGRVSYSF